MVHSVYQTIYEVVRKIPKGRVATYGQVALLAGIGRQPRRVGYALSILSDNKNVPWHRVINAKGEVSPRWEADFVDLQRDLLIKEGVVVEKNVRISLAKFQWEPKKDRNRKKIMVSVASGFIAVFLFGPTAFSDMTIFYKITIDFDRTSVGQLPDGWTGGIIV